MTQRMISDGYDEFRMNQRIRRVVRAAIKAKKKEPEEFVTGSLNITDSSHPTAVRITWIVIIIVCFTICLYQGGLRVQHYLTYPVVVDVNFEAREKLYFPVLTFCIQETDDFQKIKEQCKITISDGDVDCNDFIYLTLENCPKYGIDYNSLWNAMDSKPMFNSSLTLARGQGEVPLNFTQTILPRGVCVVVKTYEPMYFGGFDTVLEIRIRMPQEACPSSVYAGIFQVPNSPRDMRFVFVARGEGEATFAVHTVKEYSYVNRPQVNSPCWNDQIYTDCQDKCLLDRYKRELKCRLPFIPKETNLPDCQLHLHDVVQEYTKGTLMTFNTDPVTYCNCTRRCSNTLMLADAAVTIDYAENSKLGIYFIQNFVTVMTEKLSFDFITLLCEIGGNAGLWLGFSILSIIQVMHILFMQLIKKKEIHRKFDYIYGKVNKILENQQHESKPSNLHKWASIIRTIVFIVCLIGNGLFLFNRARFYSTYPTKMVVSTREVADVSFPLITICGESKSLAVLKMKIGKRRKKDCSEIDMFDTLKGNKYDSKERWRKSSLIKDFYDITELIKGKQSFEPFENVTVMPQELPSGTCIQFDIGVRPYRGTISAFMAMIRGVGNTFLPCTADHYKVYCTPPGDEVDMKNYMKQVRNVKWSVLLRQQDVRLANTFPNPCVETKIYNKCRMQCLENFIRNHLQCRLPYMTSLEVSDCNTTENARLASTSFMEFLMAMNPERDCNCIRRCEFTIYHRTESFEIVRMDIGSLAGFVFTSNLLETFQEEQVYTISSFLCDVGGNFGITIGFSVLSLFNGLQRILIFAVNLEKHSLFRRNRFIHAKR